MQVQGYMALEQTVQLSSPGGQCVTAVFVCVLSVLDLNAFERQNKAEGLGMVSEEGSSEYGHTHTHTHMGMHTHNMNNSTCTCTQVHIHEKQTSRSSSVSD